MQLQYSTEHFFSFSVCVCFSNCIFTGHSLVNCNVLHFTFSESTVITGVPSVPFLVHSKSYKNCPFQMAGVSKLCSILSAFYFLKKKENNFYRGFGNAVDTTILQIINTFSNDTMILHIYLRRNLQMLYIEHAQG